MLENRLSTRLDGADTDSAVFIAAFAVASDCVELFVGIGVIVATTVIPDTTVTGDITTNLHDVFGIIVVTFDTETITADFAVSAFIAPDGTEMPDPIELVSCRNAYAPT